VHYTYAISFEVAQYISLALLRQDQVVKGCRLLPALERMIDR
jgi:hypothetical protein